MREKFNYRVDGAKLGTTVMALGSPGHVHTHSPQPTHHGATEGAFPVSCLITPGRGQMLTQLSQPSLAMGSHRAGSTMARPMRTCSRGMVSNTP
jgi:hypothetical protein